MDDNDAASEEDEDERDIQSGKNMMKRPAARGKEPSKRQRAVKPSDDGEGSAAEKKISKAGAKPAKPGRGGRGGRGRGRGRGRARGRGYPEPTPDELPEESAEEAVDECEMIDFEAPMDDLEMEEDEADFVPAKKPAARVKAAKAKKTTVEHDEYPKKKSKRASARAGRGDEGGDVTPPTNGKKKHTVAEDEGVSSPPPVVGDGRSTFAGRRQPAHGMPHIKWSVLRQAFADHVRPHLHVSFSRHEDSRFNHKEYYWNSLVSVISGWNMTPVNVTCAFDPVPCM